MAAEEMLGAADLSRMQEYKPFLLHMGREKDKKHQDPPRRKTVNH